MIGPLFGAVVLALADWRAIFLINLAVGLVLAAALRHACADGRPVRGSGRARTLPTVDRSTSRPPIGPLDSLLACVTLVFGAIVFIRPPRAWSAT